MFVVFHKYFSHITEMAPKITVAKNLMLNGNDCAVVQKSASSLYSKWLLNSPPYKEEHCTPSIISEASETPNKNPNTVTNTNFNFIQIH